MNPEDDDRLAELFDALIGLDGPARARSMPPGSSQRSGRTWKRCWTPTAARTRGWIARCRARRCACANWMPCRPPRAP
jgi:hypothetical protein